VSISLPDWIRAMSSSPQLDDVITFLVLDYALSFLPDVFLNKLFCCCYLRNRKIFLAVICQEAHHK
jgi:hypothetical protein